MRAKKLRYENRLLLLVTLASLPGGLAALALLWTGDYSANARWTFMLAIVGVWCVAAFALRERVVRPLQTLSNLLAGLREEDYSIRARGSRKDDALGEVHRELNALVETLRDQRLGALEATALLRKVMTEIDVAVFAFDGEQRLCLVNRAGERLLGKASERLLGRRAAELTLAECLEGETPRTAQVSFPGRTGRWGVRRSVFRQEGMPHQLLVLTDLSRALRQEELQAWQRLLRVLGHELNNSLAPIKSLAGTMASLLNKESRPADWEEDMRRGLEIISTRAEALSRFMDAYTRVAKLPPPRIRPVQVASWVNRVAGLEMRRPVTVEPGPPLTIQADGDQLDQLLINLVRNAVDAVLETDGTVRVSWRKTGTYLEVCVTDDGPGLSNTANLFVPFFTTKPKGNGIGLVLGQQIAEAHGGSVSLENREGVRGCIARVRLPLG